MHLLREFVSFFPLPIRRQTMYSIRHSIIFGAVIHTYMYTPSYVRNRHYTVPLKRNVVSARK